jgi:protocatechuate 3,4-dioxygenase beta subunit
MTPCPACSRHVRDATCPFCGAAVPAPATRSVFAGAVTRAAVFSALAGCWTGSPPAEQQTTPVEQQTTPVEHHVEQPKPPPPTSGTIEGTVIDTNSGSPASFAQVTLVEANRVTQTDAHGHYKFDGVTPGKYTVRVVARAPNPRMGPVFAQTDVTLGDTGARADLQVAIPVYHYNPNQTPMPYGAPPARKRIV